MVDHGVAVALQHHDQRETAEERELVPYRDRLWTQQHEQDEHADEPYERKAQEECCAQRRTGQRAPEGGGLVAVFRALPPPERREQRHLAHRLLELMHG